ncbi:DUF2141 domain-containing protein [Sphingomonas sp. 1P06PA]|uniref:DUF2141 domain-containing protein n=1 Tax=Sphingomonas sp. 1P06PA TaxID=554121 RepID=UPI0039A518F6
MSKLKALFAAATMFAAGAVVVPAQAAVFGPDAAACARGGGEAAVLVNVEGFKQRSGMLRVQVYGDNPADFLAKGRKLKRIDVPVSRTGPMAVCVALPQPGQYAVAVRHDVDGNGKSGWNDGGGFSRNPRISLTSLKPDYREVAIPVGRGVREVGVVLNYRQGLSIKPIAMASRG